MFLLPFLERRECEWVRVNRGHEVGMSSVSLWKAETAVPLAGHETEILPRQHREHGPEKPGSLDGVPVGYPRHSGRISV